MLSHPGKKLEVKLYILVPAPEERVLHEAVTSFCHLLSVQSAASDDPTQKKNDISTKENMHRKSLFLGSIL